jgi:hypothetical protein
VLDPIAVLTACGDDADGLRRICEDFQIYAPARLAELGDALRGRDAPRLRQAAHKFCPLLLAFPRLPATWRRTWKTTRLKVSSKKRSPWWNGWDR